MMNAPDSSSPPPCCSGSPSCTAALVLGIIALVLALIGFFPCLGWIALVPAVLLAIIALIMSIVAVSKGSPKGALVVAIIALALSAGAGIVQAWMASTAAVYVEKHQDYMEKKAQEIQKDFQQMEQQNQEQLKRLRDAENSPTVDEENVSQDL
ncbi:hypothetical protein [Akkermansia muciniphila]|jgi:apolipoprotein N-acyltransferase|uniref:Uncharacterized protein n=1 Tax=Akkermansia muciniphila TaxID=239935 RepID=A0A2N8HEN4_9BACT|nr:hypothetical protein [Akkermansia muciniphila]PNC06465.1 hypothetical protein CXU21_05375 [Akkermansia muciniphila]PNC18500.1 hypothetical protein CXU22_04930 [Akkermansia muciniphila]